MENNSYVSIKKYLIGSLCAGALIVGGLIFNDEIGRVPLQGRVVKEFGSVKNRDYGFELKTNNGNSAYIGIKYVNDFCVAKGLSLEQAIEEGSHLKIERIHIWDKNKSIFVEYAHPHEVEIIPSK